MQLKLIEITKNNGGKFKETFETDNPYIKKVTFEYSGSEENLTEFLKTLIFDYARKKKIID